MRRTLALLSSLGFGLVLLLAAPRSGSGCRPRRRASSPWGWSTRETSGEAYRGTQPQQPVLDQDVEVQQEPAQDRPPLVLAQIERAAEHLAERIALGMEGQSAGQ